MADVESRLDALEENLRNLTQQVFDHGMMFPDITNEIGNITAKLQSLGIDELRTRIENLETIVAPPSGNGSDGTAQGIADSLRILASQVEMLG